MSNTTAPVTPTAGGAAAEAPARRRVPSWILILWAALLVAGFALVFTLGRPLPTQVGQRANAYAALPVPVTEEAAIAAAERIVNLDYASLASARRTVRHGTSGGFEIWTVTYSLNEPVTGVRVIISGVTGEIQVSRFP
jgi:hypothetical protein